VNVEELFFEQCYVVLVMLTSMIVAMTALSLDFTGSHRFSSKLSQSNFCIHSRVTHHQTKPDAVQEQ